jgi:hypothetical protein
MHQQEQWWLGQQLTGAAPAGAVVVGPAIDRSSTSRSSGGWTSNSRAQHQQEQWWLGQQLLAKHQQEQWWLGQQLPEKQRPAQHQQEQ